MNFKSVSLALIALVASQSTITMEKEPKNITDDVKNSYEWSSGFLHDGFGLEELSKVSDSVSMQKSKDSWLTYIEDIQRYEEIKALATILKGCGKFYVGTFLLTLAHELGHWSAARLLLNQKAFIWVDPLSVGEGGVWYISSKEVITHLFKNPKDVFDLENTLNKLREMNPSKAPYFGIPRAATGAAGPLFGFAGSYLLLKGNTFFNEYICKGRSVSEAWEETQKKALFNREQSFAIQITALFNIVKDWHSLYPWGNTPDRDGDRMFEALKIANPRPLLRKCVGMGVSSLLFCVIGNSIWKVLTHKEKRAEHTDSGAYNHYYGSEKIPSLYEDGISCDDGMR
jgi:hypothetical protein